MGRMLGSQARAARSRAVADSAAADKIVDYSEMDPAMVRSIRPVVVTTKAGVDVAKALRGDGPDSPLHGLEDHLHDASEWAGRAWQGMKRAVMGTPKPPVAVTPHHYSGAEADKILGIHRKGG